jgi:hypothetical protein
MDMMVKLLVGIQGNQGSQNNSTWGPRGQEMLPDITQQMRQEEQLRKRQEAQMKMLQLQQGRGGTGEIPINPDGKIRPFDALRIGGVQ